MNRYNLKSPKHTFIEGEYLKPCKCGSVNLEADSHGVSEGYTDTQSGWIECLDCGFEGPVVDCYDKHAAPFKAWNDHV